MFKTGNLFLALVFFFNVASVLGQQGDCDDCDTTRKQGFFIKKDYKIFRKHSCNFSKYEDSRKAKKRLCEAKYYYATNQFFKSIDFAKSAYEENSSWKFKFQIYKLMLANYKQLGDTTLINFYQKKINGVLDAFPDIEK